MTLVDVVEYRWEKKTSRKYGFTGVGCQENSHQIIQSTAWVKYFLGISQSRTDKVMVYVYGMPEHHGYGPTTNDKCSFLNEQITTPPLTRTICCATLPLTEASLFVQISVEKCGDLTLILDIVSQSFLHGDSTCVICKPGRAR